MTARYRDGQEAQPEDSRNLSFFSVAPCCCWGVTEELSEEKPRKIPLPTAPYLDWASARARALKYSSITSR